MTLEIKRILSSPFQIPPQKLLKTAFGIRGFSKSEITKVVIQTEMYLKSQRTVVGAGGGGAGQMNPPETPSLHRSVSLEGLPTSETQSNIQMMSHTLTIKEVCCLSLLYYLHWGV